MNEGSSSTTMNQDVALTYRCQGSASITFVKAALRVALNATDDRSLGVVVVSKRHVGPRLRPQKDAFRSDLA